MALRLSGYFSWNQIRSMRQGNSVPVAIDLFANEFVRDEFQRLEITVIDEIGQHDPSLGFAGLPEQLRARKIGLRQMPSAPAVQKQTVREPIAN